MKWLFLFVVFLELSACATPQIQERGKTPTEPQLETDAFMTSDGVRLGLQVWTADETVAVVAGLHGMNDYSKTFSMLGPWLAERGVMTYALDQRGFGRSPHRGVWPGADLLLGDAKSFIEAVRAAHPGLPLYVMGVSMGASVALATLAGEGAPPIAGLVLVSPAVWGWSSLNLFYRMLLWTAAHTFPGAVLTGQSLDIVPSDNVEMLRDNFHDELFIKKTRADSIYGLVTLMEKGFMSADRITVPTLLLYGEKDQIIPRRPVENVMRRLKGETRVVLYENGYHMLLRDLQAETVWTDIHSWFSGMRANLPSGEELIFGSGQVRRLSRN